ncbi:MAG: Ig-like domain-containing protein, partial [Bacteroidales bacterium]
DWGARIHNNILELTNNASSESNAVGWVFAHLQAGEFNSPYNTTLASNPAEVSWYFNMRQIRSNPSGFGSNNYGVALIIGATDTQVDSTGFGYAVVMGNTGTPDPIRFLKFTNGLQSLGVTDTIGLIFANPPLDDPTNSYMSLKLTYTPDTHVWELFGRVDGNSFDDPMSGELVSVGTVPDNEFTQQDLPYMGAYWQGSFGANQTAFFDNVSVWVDIVGAIPPSITDIIQTPESDITPETTVSVSATVTQGDAEINVVELYWGTGETELNNTIDTENTADDIFTTLSNIPAQAHSTTVYYVVYAEDIEGENTTSAMQSYLVTDPDVDIDIIEVIQPEPITVEPGVPFEELPLPETVEVLLANSESISLAVIWQEGDYDPAATGTYNLTGELALTEGLANPDNLEAQIEVTVTEPDLSELIAGWFFPEETQEADQGTEENIGKLIGREPSFEGGYTWPTGASPDNPSISSTQWNEGVNSKYWIIEFSTLNYGSITLSGKQRSSNTGPRDFKVQYRIGTQGNWTDIENSDITVANDFDSGVLSEIDLPAACNNKAFLFLRWIMTSNTSVNEGIVASAGTSRIDEIEVHGIYSDDFQQIVIGTEELPPYEVVLGTPFGEINLPDTVTVFFDDLGSEELAVTWNENDYDGNTIGTYNITGDIQLLEGMENPENIQAEAIINVIPEPEFFSVTFNIDMNAATGFDPTSDNVYITGSMFENAIPGTLPDEQLMEQVDNLIYTKTLVLLEGNYTYKYYINEGVGNPEPGPDRILELTGDVTINDVWGITNIDDFNDPAYIKIYPNPATDYINITSERLIHEIKIMDIHGKSLKVYNTSNNSVYINLPELLPGLYILNIRTDNDLILKKIQIYK